MGSKANSTTNRFGYRDKVSLLDYEQTINNSEGKRVAEASIMAKEEETESTNAAATTATAVSEKTKNSHGKSSPKIAKRFNPFAKKKPPPAPAEFMVKEKKAQSKADIGESVEMEVSGGRVVEASIMAKE